MKNLQGELLSGPIYGGQVTSWTALSLDELKRVSGEKLNDTIIQTLYDEMGEVIQKGDKRLQWGAFGNLISVQSQDLYWTASYDALGRRLTHETRSQGQDATSIISIYKIVAFDFDAVDRIYCSLCEVTVESIRYGKRKVRKYSQ